MGSGIRDICEAESKTTSQTIPVRKSRAIYIFVMTVLSIACYVAWAIWEPAPTIDAMAYHKDVDAGARSAAEADFRSHPPKARKLTWPRFLNRLENPYQREKPTIGVAIIPYTDGGKLLGISYPRGQVWLARRWTDGAWGRQFEENPTEP